MMRVCFEPLDDDDDDDDDDDKPWWITMNHDEWIWIPL